MVQTLSPITKNSELESPSPPDVREASLCLQGLNRLPKYDVLSLLMLSHVLPSHQGDETLSLLIKFILHGNFMSAPILNVSFLLSCSREFIRHLIPICQAGGLTTCIYELRM